MNGPPRQRGNPATSVTESSRGGLRGTQHTHAEEGARGRVLVVAVLLVPLGVGALVGLSSRTPADDFYAACAQVIATFFLALSVEFFARQAEGRGIQDALVALGLAGQTWVGFFACLRALSGTASDATHGLTAMGITAASVLLSLAFYDRMSSRDDVSGRERNMAAGVILIVLFSAILLLMT